MNLSTRQLSHILAVCEHRNFRRAAEAVSLSQPALSRSIRAAEDALQVKIFDRSPRGLELTPFGEVVLRWGSEVQSALDGLNQEINLMQGLAAGSCSVVLGIYPAALSGAPAAANLIGKHPQLRLRLRTLGWREVPGELLERRADLGVCELSTMAGDPRFITELIGTHRMVFYCRRGHPLAGQKRVAARDIDRYPLSMIRLPPRVSSEFPGQGVLDAESGDLIPTIEVNDLDSARRIVESSDSIGMVTPRLIRDGLQSGDLVALPFRPPWLRLQYGFVYLRDSLLSPAALAYMDEVHALEAELRESEADGLPV